MASRKTVDDTPPWEEGGERTVVTRPELGRQEAHTFPNADEVTQASVQRVLLGSAQNEIEEALERAETAFDGNERSSLCDRIETFFALVHERGLVLPQTGLYARYIRLLRRAGENRRGTAIGNQLYTYLDEKLPDDPDTADKDLFLVGLIDEASWMQYTLVEQNEDAFVRWGKRANDMYNRLVAKRSAIEGRGKIDVELRRQIMTTEMKMKLHGARLMWRQAQFHARPEEKHQLASDSCMQCTWILNEDRHARQPDSGGSDLQRVMAQILGHNIEYGSVIAETKRMRGMMLGLSYLWHEDYQMRDAEAAERTLGTDPRYNAILQEAKRLVGEYIQFHIDHPSGRTPPELWYAYLEQIRHRKMLGQHDRAFGLGQRVRRQAEEEGNHLLLSRLLNGMGEGIIVLGQKLLATPLRDPQWRELEIQARNILRLIRDDADSLPAAGLCYPLLRYGRLHCTNASTITHDAPAARIARDSACDAALTLIEAPATGPSERRHLLTSTWTQMTAQQADESDSWLFYEASAIARLGIHAEALGERPLAQGYRETMNRDTFEASWRALQQEASHQPRRQRVPRAYYDHIAMKMEAIRNFLL